MSDTEREERASTWAHMLRYVRTELPPLKWQYSSAQEDVPVRIVRLTGPGYESQMVTAGRKRGRNRTRTFNRGAYR